MVTSFLNTTLVDLLRDRALSSTAGYTFLTDGETQTEQLSYRQLDEQARSIAAHLQALRLEGERALLLYPPGLELIAAFFGCLYAGVIAVPAYPPRRNQKADRIRAIAQNAQPAVVLTVRSLQDAIDLPGRCIATDAIAPAASEWRSPDVEADAIAFLQYTSGSTSQPKGVCITHRNLLHNLSLVYQKFGHSPQSRCVIWLPPYHDMGLIGGILQPLYGNFPLTLMSPVAFLQKPDRWLQAISRDRATTSGAPNFAYERCLKISPEQRSRLDLSSWEVAFVGAEPIRVETLDRFAEAFAECGFRREAFYPCYGLAEATLFVSGGKKSDSPSILTVEKTALKQHRVAIDPAGERLVSCGQVVDQVAIVDPETLVPCAIDRIGEIWLAGTSVAQGYWNQTDPAFEAMLNGQPFLRTGDLGFLHNGELFVTGRLKDIMIIRGQNYYPQDIEATIAQSHPALQPNAGAAFVDSGDRLVVVQEVTREQWRSIDVDAAIAAVRSAVSQQHQLQVEAIALLKPNSIPKTSSGKIQRFACREGFEQGKLEAIAQWP
ncbi:MAG: fatty acyl-AMP ligase, partial [Leptolyngbyaceae cyanobacterium SM1_3_5]|nr:fatty acyl-AMP ligase [Leptolyngbyaceae cyanobacterium SM1_3_5]